MTGVNESQTNITFFHSIARRGGRISPRLPVRMVWHESKVLPILQNPQMGFIFPLHGFYYGGFGRKWPSQRGVIDIGKGNSY